MDLADLVADTRIEEDALGSGSLTGVYMRHDSDISDAR
jgi:hypothetical protein